MTVDARIFGYSDGLWKQLHDQEVKSWLEKTVVPSEPLRETMRVEFLQKVKNVTFIQPHVASLLFDNSITGKLNCGNGVLDILTGAIEPHDPKYGFKYKLHYAVDLNADGPEFFLEWLGKVMQNNIELMESLLDMMAYCLWPTYDDHVFCYLIGEGKNGKSTLIHVLESLLGKDNVSNVGLQPLCNTRFASANLEGKLANLSEESSGSGSEMSHEALNIIKALSSGGTMFVERKGQDGFNYQNKAKLIFSANQAPRFKETGLAIQRRLLVIPFKHKIVDPDSRIEEKLIAEIPKIVPMLIRRIQENIARNGRFQITRGGAAAEEAKTEMLFSSNTAYTWANEVLDFGLYLGEDHVIEVNSAYSHYREWCEENGHKHEMSKMRFSKSLVSHVIPKDSIVKRVAGKAVRVYPYVRFKQENVDGN